MVNCKSNPFCKVLRKVIIIVETVGSRFQLPTEGEALRLPSPQVCRPGEEKRKSLCLLPDENLVVNCKSNSFCKVLRKVTVIVDAVGSSFQLPTEGKAS